MMWKNTFSLILLGFVISACSENPDCMIADSVREIGRETLNKKGLYLYLRTSGFSEKEHFYELFNERPLFNECGTTATKTLYQAHVDTSLGVPEKILIQNNKIEIEYKLGEPKNQLSSVIIVLD